MKSHEKAGKSPHFPGDSPEPQPRTYRRKRMPNWNSLARCCGGAGCLNIGGIPTKTQWVSPGFTRGWFCDKWILPTCSSLQTHQHHMEHQAGYLSQHWIYTVSNAEDFELTDRIDSSGEQSPSVKSRVADNHREHKAHIYWADPEQTWFTSTANQSLSLLLPMLILVSVWLVQTPNSCRLYTSSVG